MNINKKSKIKRNKLKAKHKKMIIIGTIIAGLLSIPIIIIARALL